MKITIDFIPKLIRNYFHKPEKSRTLASVSTHQNEHISQTVEISNQATQIRRIREIIDEQESRPNPTRESYITNLEIQLENGEYKIDGRKIALKMVQDTINGLIT